MNAVATVSAPTRAGARIRRPRLPRAGLLPPLLLGVVNAAVFLVVRPAVGDLQAALARQNAASNGVGLGYWFQWFSGGATPGHYSVLSPYLSSLIGATLSGALATVALTPLIYRAARGTRFQVEATWAGTLVAGCNIWSGRIPFALGCAAAVVWIIGMRERRLFLALLGAVVSVLFSPVSGAFIAMALLGVFLLERGYRRAAFVVGLAVGATLIFVALYFGTPGPQPYGMQSALLVSLFCSIMLLARPAPSVQFVLWLTILASPVLALVPNGMGSNFSRLPYVCVPAAVLAAARARRWLAMFAVLPAIVASGQVTSADLVLAAQPAASSGYYRTLVRELDQLPDLSNYRLEVVQNRVFHTAAYVLLDHVALASGWETQEQRELNVVLQSRNLHPATYKIWLDNNAVGYVAFDKRTPDKGEEYKLVKSGRLRYLTRVWSDRTWTLYRVNSATPIVPAPARLVAATQSALTIRIPCACTVNLRVRYSKFLTATNAGTGPAAAGQAVVENDLTGWTRLRTTAPGTYILKGRPI
jgi:hypothetical protein